MSSKTSTKRSGQTFMFGAVILMISNLLVKLIGAVFKIPLQHLIADEGMAYFQAAYDIYVSFYMISTAGIPVAISRMIATSNSRGNYKEVEKIFKIAYWVFFIIGAVATVLMIGFSKVFAKTADLMGVEWAIILIAPTLFFICLSSAYRGYFQGLQNMVPTAVSQVIESLGKLGIGLIAGWYAISKGYPIYTVAAYVISGVTIGVIGATVYIAIFKRMFKSADEEKNLSGIETRSTKSLLYELVIISIPISLASSIMGLTNFIDAILVTSRLTDAWAATGLGALEANRIAKSIYGAYSMPKTLFNMPTTLIYPFAISALPALSKYYGNGDREEAKKLMESTFRVSAIVALPCALGMSAMAHPILSLIFAENKITEDMTNIDFVAPCLMVLGLSVFFLGMISVTNSVLQAYHFQNQTIISTVLGIIMKIVATYLFTSNAKFGVVGAAVGTALCYFTIMVMNMFFIVTKIKLFPSVRKTFLKPFAASVICVGPCLLTYKYLNSVLGPKITTLFAIGVAAIVYLAVLLLSKGIAVEDIKMLPKSEKIIKILRKVKLLDE